MIGPGKVIVLDTETTGLNPDLHEVFEIAWSVDFGPVQSVIVQHSLLHADPAALRINRYHERGLSPASADPYSLNVEEDLRNVLRGATLLGANPDFDRGMLRARWRGLAPWHHRALDVESQAALLFGWERPKGLMDVVLALRAEGYEIPEPDHTAAGDVATTIAVYRALREEQSRTVALAATARLRGLNAPVFDSTSLDNS